MGSADSHRLGQHALDLIFAPDNSIWVSAASIWEISIKTSVGRLEISATLDGKMSDDLERHGFRNLPIEVRHALGSRPASSSLRGSNAADGRPCDRGL